MVKENEMTLEQALDILRSGDSLHTEEAIEFLRANHPEKLAEYEESLNKPHEDDFDAIEIITQNQKDLQELSNNYDMGKKSVQQYMGKIVDRVEIYEEGQKDPLTKERKNDYLKLLFAESKLKVEQELVGSKAFYKADKKAKKEIFESAVDDCVLADLYCVHAASSAEMPKEEIKVGGKKFFEYVKEQADNFRHLFDKTIDTKDEIKVKADAILIAVADTAEKTRAFSEKLKESARSLKEDARQKVNAVAVHFMSRKNRLEERANKLSVRYKEQIKPMVKAFGKQAVDVFKANKYQMGVDILATFALSAAGFAAAPLALYGGYMVARGWVAPVWSEARMMKIKAKKEGKKLGLVERWRAAREKVKGTEKYKRKGWMTTALSAAVFVPLTALAVTSGGALPVLGAAALMPVIRAGIANLVQGNELAHAYSAYSKKKDDENLKKQVKCEAWGLGLGLLASAAGQALSRYSSEISEKLGGLLGQGRSGASAEAAVNTASGNGGQVWDPDGRLSGENNEWGFDGGMYQPGQGADGADGLGAGSDVSDASTLDGQPYFDDDSLRPTEWNENLDCRKDWFEYFYHGVGNHGKPVISDEMHLHAHMKLSQDHVMERFFSTYDANGNLVSQMSKENVILSYAMLFGFQRRAGSDLVAHTITEKSFWVNKEEMAAMYNYLFCDKKAEDIDPALWEKIHNHVANAEEFMREHADPNNHNRITEMTRDCYGVGRGSRWVGGHRPAPAPVKDPELPILNDEIVIEDEPIVIPDQPILDDKLKVEKIVLPENVENVNVEKFESGDYYSVFKGEQMAGSKDITGTSEGNAFLNKNNVSRTVPANTVVQNKSTGRE